MQAFPPRPVPAMKPILRLVMCLALLCSLPLHAQLRTIPADALRTEMKYQGARTVTLDGDAYPLSVGSLIYDTYNRSVLPQSLDAGSTYPVRVQINSQREVFKIWLLTADEAKADAPTLKAKHWWWPFS